jgi:CDP-paratose 2-epimerase
VRPIRGQRVSTALVTGSAGLIGSEASLHFASLGLNIVGVDNDMRSVFFGPEASTAWNRERLQRSLGARYTHHDTDIRDRDAVMRLVSDLGPQLSLIVHTAAQPSHDWAAREPFTDFDINAGGTLNLLEATRRHAADAVFLFCSTNKVYGDTPNQLPLLEHSTRWEIDPAHTYVDGIREDMAVDRCLHSLFGASKLSADILVQEYGRYFGLRTACFRGGTLTGPAHSATELHGFLGYVMRCAMTGSTYTVHGYLGKQVRDAIHSSDLVRAFEHFYREPRVGAVYNIGGGRSSNSSVLEAIELSGRIAGREMRWNYDDTARTGDHIWWISSNASFRAHYPEWDIQYDVPRILEEIHDANGDRWHA